MEKGSPAVTLPWRSSRGGPTVSAVQALEGVEPGLLLEELQADLQMEASGDGAGTQLSSPCRVTGTGNTTCGSPADTGLRADPRQQQHIVTGSECHYHMLIR